MSSSSSTTEAAGGSGAAGRPPLWFIYSVTVSGVLSNSLISPNIPDVLDDLGQPESQAGLLVAVSPLPGVLMAPIIGILADRYGRRRVLLPCLVVFAVSAILAAVAPSFGALLVARFLQGVGGAGLINLAVVLIGDHWDGIDRTRLIGRNSAVLTVCLALVPSISGVVAEVSNWRASLSLGVVAFPVAVAGWLVLPDVRPGAERTVADQLRGAAAVLRAPAVLGVLATGFVLFVVIFGVFLTALPVHLDDEFGLSAGPRGVVLSTFAVGAAVAAFNLGRIKARVGARPLLVGCFALISVSAAGIGLAPTLALVVVASVVYGLGEGAVIPALQDLLAGAAPTEQRAAVIASWVSCIRLGQAIGPLAAAATFAATSTQTTMLIGAGLLAGVAAFLAVAPMVEEEPAGAGAWQGRSSQKR